MTRSPLTDARLSSLVVAWHLDGVSLEAIAARLAATEGVVVSRESVRRHVRNAKRAQAMDTARAVAVVEAGSPAIADKAYRLRELQALSEKCLAVVNERGLMEVFPTKHGAAERFNAPLVREIRELFHEAAVQLGQIPTGKLRDDGGDQGPGGVHLYQFNVITSAPGGNGYHNGNGSNGRGTIIDA